MKHLMQKLLGSFIGRIIVERFEDISALANFTDNMTADFVLIAIL